MCLPFRIDDQTLRNDMHTFHSAATAILVMILGTACSSPPSALPEPSAIPIDAGTSAPALDPVDIAQQKSVEAYRGMWDAYVEASRTADWRSPYLSRFATGTALATLTQGLHSASDKGLVARGEPVLRPSVSSVEPQDRPSKAIVTDCGDSTGWTQQRVDNGALADDEPGGRRRINAVVEKQVDGSWKVAAVGVHEVGSC